MESPDNKEKNPKSYFKDKYLAMFWAVLAVSIIVRLYYFFLTKNQPLWWDEADYMGIAKLWGGIMQYPLNVARPLLLPILMFFIQEVGLREIGVRIFILISSILSVILIYLLGEMFLNKKAGIISAILLSSFWSFTFYSFRLLVDVPLTMLCLATSYFFFKAYFSEKNWKYSIFPGFLLGLAFLMKFTAVALVFVFGIYLLFTERTKVFNNKKIYAFYLASLITVLPYFIWQYLNYGTPFAFYNTAVGGISSASYSLISAFFGHLKFSAQLLGTVMEVLFFIALLWFLFEFLLMYKFSISKKTKANKYLFILLWVLISLAIFSKLFPVSSAEDRYYFVFYPAVFLIISGFIVSGYEFLRKNSKVLAIALLFLLLGFVVYQNSVQADSTIKGKLDSFKELKQAGEWINSHTTKDESILVTEESAETIYYAERKYNVENHNIANETDLINRIKLHNPSYIVLSFYYYLGRNNGGSVEVLKYIFSRPEAFQVVQTYGPYVDQQKTLPLVVIVRVNRDKLNF